MIPRAIFDADHEMFRGSVRKFIETEVAPHHHQWEKDGQVSREVWLKAGEQGFLSPSVPEEYGGFGVDFRYNTIVTEESYGAGMTGLGWSLSSDIAVPYITHYGSEEQKQKYLPKCVSGECVVAIAMTEPGTGSDLQGIKTTAVKDGDDYIINGSKTFITNGQLADLVIVVAKTDPNAGSHGTSLFLVEAGTPGFTKGNKLEKIGLKAQDTSELFFQDMRVPKEALLGEEGRGFAYLMNDLPQERLTCAIMAIASAEMVIKETVQYAKDRKLFGKSLSDFQNTQFKLAELDAEVTAMRVFVDHCIALHIEEKLETADASKAKMLCTDLQFKVAHECLQLHGGFGYMWEYPVARAFVDSRVQSIYAGTNEVMKLIIARELFSE